MGLGILVGKDSVFFKYLKIESLTIIQYIVSTNWTWYLLSSFHMWEEDTRLGVGLGGLGSEYAQGILYKTPK